MFQVALYRSTANIEGPPYLREDLRFLGLSHTKRLLSLLVARFRALRALYLEIWMVKGFDYLARVAEARSLEMLFLQSLKDVTVIPLVYEVTHLKSLTWTR